MTIGVKYWALGAAAPGSWTNIDVVISYPREKWVSYDADTSGQSLDGTTYNHRRKFLRATLRPGPLTTAASRATIVAMLDAFYVRIKDTRLSYLGDANTVNWIHEGESEFARSAASLLTEDIVIELITESPQ